MAICLLITIICKTHVNTISSRLDFRDIESSNVTILYLKILPAVSLARISILNNLTCPRSHLPTLFFTTYFEVQFAKEMKSYKLYLINRHSIGIIDMFIQVISCLHSNFNKICSIVVAWLSNDHPNSQTFTFIIWIRL